MDERDTREPLKELGDRLDKARDGRPGSGRAPDRDGAADADRNALGLAWRIGLELVVAVAVGTAIGWALDRWLGTRPWGMIVFLFLGFGAGIWNVYRALAGMGMAMGNRRGERPAAGDRTGTSWSDDDED
jgi:ATP synthase protein I